ncbi:D-alanyl-D-alanine carboxypeptidase family protein [Sulfobacillus thermosulfidooxidans]|uniref:D-alanyl-D-alanine carboxypeptidase family protein n=1 Tax=Sulfobacillus thermosulfidooxidans TaxID=28034 RepID=UPI000B17E993|nr:D-alanyl-D-alanine carboxypeptidase family protein [Sulfobacillus thermosulfidooxidans]
MNTRRRIALALTSILSTFALSTSVYAASTVPPSPPSLSAQGAILVDANTGQILYGRHIRQEFYPASITKIMTAYLAITHGWNKTVRVSVQAQNQPGSSCYLRAGQAYPMPRVVSAMMMVSGNDAAYAIAQTVGGTVSHFVHMMNQTAHRWHAPGIHFANPSGLPNPHHVVSALGMAIITEHAMANPIFRQIVATKVASLPPDPAPRIYYNQNRLLYTYPGAIGVKIGYTIEADETIVGAAKRHGITLIEVLLKDTPAGLWPDAANLLSWGFQHFSLVHPIQAGAILGTVDIGHRPILVKSGANLNYLAYPGESIHPVLHFVPDTHLVSKPITRNEMVGSVQVTINGQDVGSLPLISLSSMAPYHQSPFWRWKWVESIVAVMILIKLLSRHRYRRRKTLRVNPWHLRGSDSR